MNPQVIPTCIAFWPGEKELNLHIKHTTLEHDDNQLFLNLGRVSHECQKYQFLYKKMNIGGPVEKMSFFQIVHMTKVSTYGHNFLCDTALPSWRFWLGTLALTTGSLRPKIGGICSRHFHSSHLKPIHSSISI